MTYGGFEKKLNKVIYDTLNGHRHFNMDKIFAQNIHEFHQLELTTDPQPNLYTAL